MIAKQQAQHYVQAKQKHLDRLSTLVWHLTGQADLFTSAMRIALFDIWQQSQNINLSLEAPSLYPIAIEASRKAWNHRNAKLHTHDLSTAQQARYQATQLPNSQAQLVLMRYMEGLGNSDIAQHLSMTSFEVDMALTQALQHLKDRFAQDSATERTSRGLTFSRGPIIPTHPQYQNNRRPA